MAHNFDFELFPNLDQFCIPLLETQNAYQDTQQTVPQAHRLQRSEQNSLPDTLGMNSQFQPSVGGPNTANQVSRSDIFQLHEIILVDAKEFHEEYRWWAGYIEELPDQNIQNMFKVRFLWTQEFAYMKAKTLKKFDLNFAHGLLEKDYSSENQFLLDNILRGIRLGIQEVKGKCDYCGDVGELLLCDGYNCTVCCHADCIPPVYNQEETRDSPEMWLCNECEEKLEKSKAKYPEFTVQNYWNLHWAIKRKKTMLQNIIEDLKNQQALRNLRIDSSKKNNSQYEAHPQEIRVTSHLSSKIMELEEALEHIMSKKKTNFDPSQNEEFYTRLMSISEDMLNYELVGSPALIVDRKSLLSHAPPVERRKRPRAFQIVHKEAKKRKYYEGSTDDEETFQREEDQDAEFDVTKAEQLESKYYNDNIILDNYLNSPNQKRKVSKPKTNLKSPAKKLKSKKPLAPKPTSKSTSNGMVDPLSLQTSQNKTKVHVIESFQVHDGISTLQKEVERKTKPTLDSKVQPNSHHTSSSQQMKFANKTLNSENNSNTELIHNTILKGNSNPHLVRQLSSQQQVNNIPLNYHQGTTQQRNPVQNIHSNKKQTPSTQLDSSILQQNLHQNMQLAGNRNVRMQQAQHDSQLMWPSFSQLQDQVKQQQSTQHIQHIHTLLGQQSNQQMNQQQMNQQQMNQLNQQMQQNRNIVQTQMQRDSFGSLAFGGQGVDPNQFYNYDNSLGFLGNEWIQPSNQVFSDENNQLMWLQLPYMNQIMASNPNNQHTSSQSNNNEQNDSELW